MINIIDPNQSRTAHFVKKVCSTGEVFTLQSTEGYPVSDAAELTDEEGNPLSVMAFWSDKESALECAKTEWLGFTLKSILLPSFLEDWCFALYEDYTLVGTDINIDLPSYEIEPFVLAKEILEFCAKMGIKLSFQNYDSSEEFLKEISKY